MSRKEPLCYAVGEEEFKLFELIPKANAPLHIGERTYIGKDPSKRVAIDHVKRRIGYDELTTNAVAELDYALAEIVRNQEQRFIRFFNYAEPLSMRKHLLEELPGLGKKSMTTILDERKVKLFESFADMTARAGIKAPEKLIASRIEMEIRDPTVKRYIFVK